jgi:hypothetical protein
MLGSIELMSKNIFLTIAALIVLALGWLAWDYCQFAKQDEASRMSAASKMLGEKLASYLSAHGRYPDSLDMLSFTNSTSEIEVLPDIRKISYKCLDGGQHFSISYHGFFGYRIEGVSNNYRKRE